MTKKILHIDATDRKFWTVEEARAMVKLEGAKYNAEWEEIYLRVNKYTGERLYAPEVEAAMLAKPMMKGLQVR